MLEHHPKLKELWNKCPKVESRRGDIITLEEGEALDEFTEEMYKTILNSEKD